MRDVRTNDASWVITSEVALEFQWPEEAPHDPLWVRVIAIPDEGWLDRQWDRVNLTERIPPRLHWEKHLLEFTPYAVHAEIDNLAVVANYVDQVLTRSGAWQYDRPQVTKGLLENMRVPVFGSPPKDWAKLGSLLGVGGGLTGAGILAGVGAEPSLTLVLILGGATLFVNIVVPVSRAIGRGLEHRIDQLMGTPPRPPAELE